MTTNTELQYKANDAAPAKAGAASVAIWWKLLCAAILIAYAACVLYITLFSRSPSLSRAFSAKLLGAWVEMFKGDRVVGKELVENIVLFIPLGFLTTALFARGRRLRPLPAPVLGLALSLGVEIAQYFSGRGKFSLSDLFNNTLGAALGLAAAGVAFLLFDPKKRAGRRVLYGALPAVLLVSGLLGCWLMRDRLTMMNLHADQFGFFVDQVAQGSFEGRCMIYDRDTPNYRLFLVGEKETREARVIRQGKAFIAKAEHTDGRYELRIRFEGYPTLRTGVWLDCGRLKYTEEDPPTPVGSNGQPLVTNAALKAYSPEWDIYVYQSGEQLIWLFGSKVGARDELICQPQTNEPELLPENRRQYGFDNLGFRAEKVEEEPDGGYRRFVRTIPSEYPVTAIVVGLNTGGDVVWSSAFRP